MGVRRLRTQDLAFFLPRALGPTRWKFKVFALYGHRLLRHNCGSRAVAGHPPDYRRTKQVGRHQAVYDRSNPSHILMAKGPKARE